MISDIEIGPHDEIVVSQDLTFDGFGGAGQLIVFDVVGDIDGVVPVPAAVWLLGSGLLGLIGLRRRA